VQSCSRALQPVSERVPHAEFQSVGLLVFVAREDPGEPIVFFVFEQHDLIVDRRAQAARESQVDAIRHAFADREPGRGTQARCLLAGGVDERRRQLKGVHAEGLLEDLAHLRRNRRGERLGGPGRQDVGLRLIRQRAQLDVLLVVAAHVAEQQREHVGRRQRGIRAHGRLQPLGRAGESDVDVIGLHWRPGHADVGFRLDVDLIFYDTTTAYFEIDEPDENEQEFAGRLYAPLRKRGHSKEGRDNQPQVIIALAVTRDGMPVRSWVLPGNTADVTTVARIKDDLRAWRLGRCLFVGDAGMYSADNLAQLSRGLGRYILAVPMRRVRDIADEVLTRPGRFKPV